MLESIQEQQDIWTFLQKANKPSVLYGMGDGALKILKACEHFGIHVDGVFASDEYVRGHHFAGYPVRTLTQTERFFGTDDFIILMAFAVHDEPTIDKIRQIARRHVLRIPDVPVIGDGLFNWQYLKDHESDIRAAYEMLEDVLSRKVYRDTIEFKLSGKLVYLDQMTTAKEAVYAQLLQITADESYVDIGAYDGDTIQEFLLAAQGKYREIIAFEPDAKNFRKLERYVHESALNHISLYPVASHHGPGFLSFDNRAGRNSALSDSGRIKIAADSVDRICDGRPVSLIKMDVEGAEAETLMGCRKTIQANRPRMIISAYHRTEDLFSLPLLLRSVYPGCRLYLRHHPYIPAWETNLYVLPPLV